MVKIFILASLKKASECINLASAIHNKNGCQVIILVPSIDYLNFPKTNIETIQINNDIKWSIFAFIVSFIISGLFENTLFDGEITAEVTLNERV